MEFKHIEYFVEACNHRNFSKAARNLFISQQALSRCIGNLERVLGCILFIRTVKGIDLTDEGKYLFEKFRPIVQSFHDASIQAAARFENRPVRLPFCCAPGIIRNISPDLLISFSEKYPKIALEANELSDKLCDDYIREDARHFGLLLSREWADRPRFGTIIIKTEPSYLLVHKDHPFADRKSVSLGQLRDERVLTLDKSSYQLEHLNQVVAPLNFSVRPFYESSDVMQLCALVGRGKGVLICIRQIYEESGLGNVVLVPIEERIVDYCIAFAFQDYDALDTAAKQFIQYVIDNIKNVPAGDGQATDVNLSARL
jgi:DNA-binding transcriptional LysR family regulator